MADEDGEPVGLTMGFQAGGLIGLYLGFSLATISVLTDAENIQRTISLMCGWRFCILRSRAEVLYLTRGPAYS